MRPSRLFAVSLAGAVALTPAVALAAPGHPELNQSARHSHGSHHGHHHGRHGRKAELRHRLLASVQHQSERLAALRHRITHDSTLTDHERSVLLDHADAQRRQLEALHRRVQHATSVHQLAALRPRLDHEGAVVPAESNVHAALHETEADVALLRAATHLLHSVQRHISEEEEPSQMRDLDVAITDLDDAQSRLAHEVHDLLGADPTDPGSMSRAAHRAARDDRAATADVHAAIAALRRVQRSLDS
jgi:hypothetical protein